MVPAVGDGGRALNLYALLMTLFDNWTDLFRNDAKRIKARIFVSLAMNARI